MAHRHHSSSSRRPGSEQEPDEMIADFRRGRELGKGSFATVYLVQHTKRKSYAAVKCVQQSKLSSKLKANLEKEIDILKDLRHPHIVALFTVKENPYWYYLVMEYCQLSDLSQFLKKRHNIATLPETRDIFTRYPNPEHGGLNEVLSRHFIKQLASALQYLRSQNLIHRDIKPQNMLLNPSPVEMSKWQPDDVPLAASEYSLVPAVGVQTLPMLKLADFGFARHLPNTSMAETLCGSPLYMAPEILRYEKYESRADLWSTGGVLYELVVGRPPFRAQNHVELLRKIERANDVIAFDNKNMTVSRGMKDLIRKLLKKSPLSRCSWDEFFEDPVITGDIPGLLEDDQPFLITKNKTIKEDTQLSRRMAKQAIDSPDQARPSSGHVPQPRTSQDESRSRDARKGSDPDTALPTPDMTRRRSSPGVPQQQETAPRDIQRRPSQRESTKARRPSIVAHATAPARQDLLPSSGPSAAPVTRMERRPSRTSPLAGPPMVREPSAVAITGRRDDRAARDAREAREQTAQDVAFEKEYVMIEKRAVEINAFADQLENQNFYTRNSPDNNIHGAGTGRRATATGAQASSTSTATAATGSSPSRAMQVAVRPQPTHQRAGSFERRYAPSPQSATNMLTKALTAANFRLFGGAFGTSPPFGKGPSPPPSGYNAFPAYPAPQSALLLGDGNESNKAPLDEDTKIVRTMEEAATRSDVIYGFADVKFRQLVPATPSAATDALGILQIGAHERAASTEEDGDGAADGGRDMTTLAVAGVAEEALVLFVKTLAILTKTIDLAGYWWNKHHRGDFASFSPDTPTATAATGGGSSPRPTSANNAAAPPTPESTGKRVNGIVQWARARFNDCLERSEITARRLQAAQRDLPPDHPANPANHTGKLPSSTTQTTTPAPASATAQAISTSAEQIHITSGITAEKLMFERAVEMSRSAALSELMGEGFADCEISYMTAIMLLEALLEGDDEPLMRKPSAHHKGRSPSDDHQGIEGLEGEERSVVVKLIESARSRLGSLRRKIAAQQLQQQQGHAAATSATVTGKRSSVSSASSGHATPKPVAAATAGGGVGGGPSPAIAGTPPR